MSRHIAAFFSDRRPVSPPATRERRSAATRRRDRVEARLLVPAGPRRRRPSRPAARGRRGSGGGRACWRGGSPLAPLGEVPMGGSRTLGAARRARRPLLVGGARVTDGRRGGDFAPRCRPGQVVARSRRRARRVAGPRRGRGPGRLEPARLLLPDEQFPGGHAGPAQERGRALP